ncbi:MAG: DUF2283 domain-containing protein [Candidatus Aenigmarchaeota archaeon]|nr:DUF2283 domain-containing protein [Candidatus Aenigmarchaeota archaeon]
MKVTYDKEADAAFIYLKEKIEKGEVKNTISMNDNIILDFDSNKKLIGIEILSASKVIPKNTVSQMEIA